MKRYVTLKCSVCARSRDSLIDLKYYKPDRCTITLGCEGRLSPSGYTSDGNTLLGVPPVGLTNWYPRWQQITTTQALQADRLYDTSTGAKKQFIVAVSNAALGFNPSPTSTLTLNFLADQQTPRDYKQYTYRRSGSFITVNGVEDGAAKKVLRYNITGVNPDQVEVYVNGVKRAMGTGADQYQLYDYTISSLVPPNTVSFNTPVTGSSTQVDVIVTKAATLSAFSIVLNRAIDDDSRVGTGAWEGVDLVQNPATGEQFSLFYSDFAELIGIPIDIKLRLDPNTPNTIQDSGISTVPPTAAMILLSRTYVYTELDRLRSKRASLSALSTNTGYLMVKLLDGTRSLMVAEDAVSDLFPPLSIIRFNTPTPRRTGLAGNDAAAELDNAVIIGPDA